MATALGLAACRMGRRVRFVTVAGLVTELAEAQAEHRLSKLEAALDRLDLLICDELGFVRLDPDQSQLLITLLACKGGTPLDGQAAELMDHESEVISGRPCDSPGCASSADPLLSCRPPVSSETEQ